jgi:flagellar motor switch protein FliM
MTVLRLKQGAARDQAGLDRVWALALARAARDEAGLRLTLADVRVAVLSLAEVLELPPEQALIAVLDEDAGPGLGLMVLSAEVLAGVVEQMATGQVQAGRAAARRPTRTDAALVAPMMDAALAALEAGRAAEGAEAGEDWARGYRFASTVPDARALGLLLEDISYRVLRGVADLAEGAKGGEVILVLPERRREVHRAVVSDEADFNAALAAQVDNAEVRMEAVLLRVPLTLGTVLGFQLGQVIDLPQADLARIAIEGMDGRPVAQGRLGRQGGLRAVRVTEVEGAVLTRPAELPGVLDAG